MQHMRTHPFVGCVSIYIPTSIFIATHALHSPVLPEPTPPHTQAPHQAKSPNRPALLVALHPLGGTASSGTCDGCTLPFCDVTSGGPQASHNQPRQPPEHHPLKPPARPPPLLSRAQFQTLLQCASLPQTHPNLQSTSRSMAPGAACSNCPHDAAAGTCIMPARTHQLKPLCRPNRKA
jgi:hypothetical protein